MKTFKTPEGPVTKPLLKRLVQQHQADLKKQVRIVTVGSKPLPPPDLYQDAGGGFNSNLSFLQS